MIWQLPHRETHPPQSDKRLAISEPETVIRTFLLYSVKRVLQYLAVWLTHVDLRAKRDAVHHAIPAFP